MDLALHRLVKRKVLRRLARGLYEYPRQHPELGVLALDIQKVAQALAGGQRMRLQPTGGIRLQPAWFIGTSAGKGSVPYRWKITHGEDRSAGD
nr:protein of unknown function (DUF4095) [uncultured bacterium]